MNINKISFLFKKSNLSLVGAEGVVKMFWAFVSSSAVYA